MRDYIKELDEIVLSDSVVQEFYDKYNTDLEFKNWLDREIPEIKKCEEQKQNNPWHKYNVLKHILYSVEAMNGFTKELPFSDRRMLAYTMFLHDIGKPEAHIVREKEGKHRDSFFNHNIVSCRIAKTVLPKLNFNERERKIIDKLIYKHDIFMFIKEQKTSNPHWRVLDNDLIREEIDDLNQVGDGEKLMKYLIMIGRCDNLAQNEKMTGDSLRMLAKFDKMLDELIGRN